MMSDRLGKLHFWMMLISFNLTFFPQHFLGLHGMPRRTFTYEAGLGFEAMNLLSTVGALLLGASMLIFIWNVLTTLRKGLPAGDNPWEGSTLEWSISSPPPHYNFRALPKVRGRDPLWAEDTRDAMPGDDPSLPEPHMPGPSYFPLGTAAGILVMAAGGLTTTLPVVLVGVAVTLFGIYGWAFQPLEH
jgi:cytochrome c oxidase subunit 1